MAKKSDYSLFVNFFFNSLKIWLIIIFRLSLFTIHYYFGSLFTIHYKKGPLFTNHYTPSRPSYMYQWQNQHALPLVHGWILAPLGPWRWQEKLLCSFVGITIKVTCSTTYTANLMLVECAIASHAKVWTCQFWWKFYQELTVTMVQVQREQHCQLKVNIMSNRKKVMLPKHAPLNSHLADYDL